MDDALRYGAYGCAAVITACWLLGVISREHSWVDRLWSLLPPLYVAWFASHAIGDPRLFAMTVLAGAWGARLTFNFARKGGYAKGGEDYRWPVLRQRMKGWQWQLFAFLFVAGIQNVVLFLLTLPAWAALAGPSRPLSAIDAIAAALFVCFLIGETIADEQQWRFHQRKRAATLRGEELETPFCATGLFRYSRHPNFFCEQAIWWSFYLFAVAATGHWLSPVMLGPLLLTALFQGSTRFTEQITLSKYPRYAEYQRRTSRLFPWFASAGFKP